MPDPTKVLLGAENIFSPLGSTAAEHFSSCSNGISGIMQHQGLTISNEPVWVSRFKDASSNSGTQSRILQMLLHSVTNALSRTNLSKSTSRVALLLSTTKGDIEQLEKGNPLNSTPDRLLKALTQQLGHTGRSFVVSNACISGTHALILAHDLVVSGEADHVIVTGADLVSKFTVTGFQSLFALSKEACRPFCKTRSGISLGEGAATIIVSRDRGIFTEECFQLAGGATANDANHISGPSRTGEGLYRTVQKALAQAKKSAGDIDFISAHGTATLYNDDMESVAFTRAGLAAVPLNSFKGYFGHTLGAAGVIETAMCLQSMRNNVLIKNAGMLEQGTAQPLNAIQENFEKELNVVLKTASGFGGCNAALLIQKSKSN